MQGELWSDEKKRERLNSALYLRVKKREVFNLVQKSHNAEFLFKKI